MSDATSSVAVKPKSGRKGGRTRGERALHRLDVVVRTVAAIGMGYVTASLSTATLARLLPGPVEEATIAATTFSFVVYVSVAVWAFADAKAWRVWAGLLTLCAVLAGVLWWSVTMEPRL